MEGSPRSLRVRSWLRRSPVPDKVLGELPDGDEKVVKMSVGRNRWSDCEKCTRDCVRLTAMDAEGSVLRSLDLSNEFELDSPVSTAHGSISSIRERLESKDLRNVLGEVLPMTIERISRSMIDAFNAGAQSKDDQNKHAYDALVAIVQGQSSIVAQTQSLLLDMQRRWYGLASSLPEGAGASNPTDAMAMQVLSKAFGGGGAPNGNGHSVTVTPEMFAQLTQFMQAMNGGGGSGGSE